MRAHGCNAGQRELGRAAGARQREGIPTEGNPKDGKEEGEDVHLAIAHAVDARPIRLAHKAEHQQGEEEAGDARGQPDQVQVVQEVGRGWIGAWSAQQYPPFEVQLQGGLGRVEVHISVQANEHGVQGA